MPAESYYDFEVSRQALSNLYIASGVASLLISRNGLSGPVGEAPVVGLPDEVSDEPDRADLNHVSLLRMILVLNVAILIGFAVDELVAETGVKLPLFVVCLLVAIVLTNTVAGLLPQLQWPTRTRERGEQQPEKREDLPAP
jgi:glutamate:Na+ symporter, ESS family